MIDIEEKEDINNSIEKTRYINGYYLEMVRTDIYVMKHERDTIRNLGAFNAYDGYYKFKQNVGLSASELKAVAYISGQINSRI